MEARVQAEEERLQAEQEECRVAAEKARLEAQEVRAFLVQWAAQPPPLPDPPNRGEFRGYQGAGGEFRHHLGSLQFT